MAAPTGGTINVFKAQTGRFKVGITAVTGDTQGTEIWLHTSSPATDGVKVGVMPPGWTTDYICISDEDTPLADDTLYYCITRPFNGADVSTNTTEMATKTYGASNPIIMKQPVDK